MVDFEVQNLFMESNLSSSHTVPVQIWVAAAHRMTKLATLAAAA